MDKEYGEGTWRGDKWEYMDRVMGANMERVDREKKWEGK